MDGHGSSGKKVVTFVHTKMAASIYSQQQRVCVEPTEVLRQIYKNVHQELKMSNVDCSCSGTTCVLAHIIGNKIVCANTGDSRCVLGYRGPEGQFVHKELSMDHKPTLPEEKRRIELSGGRVEPMMGQYNEPIGPSRVWVGNEMYPGLAMSRSIGDTIAQSVGVSCDPEFLEHIIDFTAESFLILASDGIWEFVTSEEAVKIVSAQNTPEVAARSLCEAALRRWHEEEEICDDITAIVVYFKPKKDEEKSEEEQKENSEKEVEKVSEGSEQKVEENGIGEDGGGV
jgi:serine/threonine protein phosphatase PrpC